MMPELGNFLLCLALGISLLLSVYPQWGAVRQDTRLMALARPLSWMLFISVMAAFLILVYAFVVNDFTIMYVASNSNAELPVWYRVAATWGAHEGSLLLWVLLMSAWTFAVATLSRGMPLDSVARVLSVMGMVNFGFLLFILLTSDPFTRTLPEYPIDGRDLNPLLQDVGLIFHPPLLYMGYVGFSVAFAFAIASLMAGRLDTAWARWSRPWTQAAWIFLTLGIVLGSAWAYYELLFILLTSDPFTRTLPEYPIDGRDLNPLLQDVGLIFHPPLLYMGYVGFSVAFAFAIASLMAGRLDTAWARWSRPWTQAAWIFLTLGIVLGSAWAYYELGWGGWWFWDPVENASLMPWLAGTALMHSLAVTEKRGSFKAWTVLLAIAAFSLCLLGTFLVRSGVLVSVHSFASDPARGMFILALLVIAIGGSLLLYAVKGNKVRARVKNDLWSRETFLLGNNILLMAAMLVVLLGTLLPLVHKQLGLGSISIGEPFFNMMFTAMMVPFALLLGIGPLVRWRRDEPGKVLKRLGIAVVITLAGALLLPWLMQDRIEAMTVVGD